MNKLLMVAGYLLALLGGLMAGYWLITILAFILWDVSLLPNDPYGNKSLALIFLGATIGGGGVALALSAYKKENK